MLDVKELIIWSYFHTTHRLSHAFFPPDGSVEVSHGCVKAKQIKPCTHAPSTRDVWAGTAVVFLGVSHGTGLGAPLSPLPQCFQKTSQRSC